MNVFLYPVSFLLFAATLAKSASREDYVYPTVETLRNGEKRMKFRALDQDIELQLEPAGDIIAEDFALIDANGQRDHSIDVESLKRKLYRDKRNGAALLIDEDGPLNINGIVSRELRIKPDDIASPVKNRRKAHRIVEEKFDNTFVRDTIIPMEIKEDFTSRTRREINGKCIVIDMLFMTDSYFTHKYESMEDLTEYVTLKYTEVQILLESLHLGIKSRLIGIMAFENGTEPSFVKEAADPYLKKSVNPFRLLEKASHYLCYINRENEYIKRADLIMLFIDQDFVSRAEDGSAQYGVGGIAYGGAVCKCNKIGITNHYGLPGTIAHEISHLLGAPDDGDSYNNDYPGSADCPQIPRQTENFFSNCSRENILYHITRSDEADCMLEDCKNDDESNENDIDDY